MQDAVSRTRPNNAYVVKVMRGDNLEPLTLKQARNTLCVGLNGCACMDGRVQSLHVRKGNKQKVLYKSLLYTADVHSKYWQGGCSIYVQLFYCGYAGAYRVWKVSSFL